MYLGRVHGKCQFTGGSMSAIRILSVGLLQTSILLTTMGCRMAHFSPSRQILFSHIDQNSRLSSDEKGFAKRYHSFVMRNLLPSPEPHPEKILSDSSPYIKNLRRGPWGISGDSQLSYEEKLYLINIPKMIEEWRKYSDIDMDKLSVQEEQFIKDVHLKHGNGPVRASIITQESAEKLRREQRLLLELSEALSGSSEFGDREIVFLYRKGGASLTSLEHTANTVLPPKWSRKISAVKYCGEGKFLLSMLETEKPRMGGTPWLYHSVLCDKTGKILRVNEIDPIKLPFLPQKYGDVISNRSDLPQTWMWVSTKEPNYFNLFDKTGSWIDDRLYVGSFSQSGLDIKVLLSTKGKKQRLKNWWYFETEEKKLVFVIVCDYRFPEKTPERQPYASTENHYIYHLLRCYEYNENGLNFLREFQLDDKDRICKQFAFGIDGDSFYLWVTDSFRYSSAEEVIANPGNHLRVATLQEDGALEWRRPYHGQQLFTLNVNPLCASAVRVSERKTGEFSSQDDMIFAVQGENIKHHQFAGKGKFFTGIAYIRNINAWAVVTWEGYPRRTCVTFMDTNLNVLEINEIPTLKQRGYLYEFHLVNADGKLYLIVLTGEKKDSVLIQEIDYSHLN